MSHTHSFAFPPVLFKTLEGNASKKNGGENEDNHTAIAN